MDPAAPDGGATYQASLVTPDTNADAFLDGGGPTLVTVGQDWVTIDLAGPVQDGDLVSVMSTTTQQTVTKPLTSFCKHTKPHVDALSPVSLSVTTTTCPGGSPGALASVTNPNEVGRQYQRSTGLDEVPYTVVLLNAQSGVLNSSQQLNFAGPTTKASCLTPSAGLVKPASFMVRAIGVDGSVVSQQGTVTLKAPPAPPVPPTSGLTKVPPAPGSSHAQPAGKPAVTHSAASQPQADVTSGTSTAQAGGFSANASQDGSALASQEALAATVSSPTASRPPPILQRDAGGKPSSASVVITATPTPTGPAIADPRFKTLADPPLDTRSRIFVWQGGAALIVLAMALAVSGMIGGVVWSAKRR